MKVERLGFRVEGVGFRERMTLLERDVAHTLHAHLDHVTSVPNMLCTILKRF